MGEPFPFYPFIEIKIFFMRLVSFSAIGTDLKSIKADTLSQGFSDLRRRSFFLMRSSSCCLFLKSNFNLIVRSRYMKQRNMKSKKKYVTFFFGILFALFALSLHRVVLSLSWLFRLSLLFVVPIVCQVGRVLFHV